MKEQAPGALVRLVKLFEAWVVSKAMERKRVDWINWLFGLGLVMRELRLFLNVESHI